MQENKRARAEAALARVTAEAERQRRLFEAIISSTPDLVYVFDLNYRFTFANEALRQMWGRTLEESVGKSLLEIGYEPWHAEMHEREIDQVVASKQPVRGEVPFLHATLGRRIYDYIFVPVINAHGEVEAVAGTTRDVTERKQAEQKLHESEENLRALSRSLERQVDKRTAELRHQALQRRHLASELATAERRERRRLAALLHDDLQQWLVAAKLRLDRVRCQLPDPQAASEIEEAVELLGQAMTSSRDLTRRLRPPGLYEDGLVPALRWLASELARLHGLHVVIDAQDERPLSDDINAMLFEAVRELLFNVVKHAGVSEATILVRQGAQWLQIAVEDAGGGGGGVAAVEQRLQPDAQASGIGLLSIRERLAALGGDMTVEPVAGGGTCVRLSLPIAAAQGEQAAGPARREGRRPTRAETAGAGAAEHRVRVLVVDDHTIVRQAIAAMLSGDQRLVVAGEAANGVEAIEAVERHQPDVVLIDVNMPRMNGLEATREIRRRWPGVHVVALSIQDDDTVVNSMITAGAAGFVSKSDDAERMISAVLAPLA